MRELYLERICHEMRRGVVVTQGGTYRWQKPIGRSTKLDDLDRWVLGDDRDHLCPAADRESQYSSRQPK